MEVRVAIAVKATVKKVTVMVEWTTHLTVIFPFKISITGSIQIEILSRAIERKVSLLYSEKAPKLSNQEVLYNGQY